MATTKPSVRGGQADQSILLQFLRLMGEMPSMGKGAVYGRTGI